MADDFLSRWSRRKLENPATAAEVADAAEAPDAAELTPELRSAPLQEELADDTITPEELAALPPLADISALTDVTAFLRKGVPLALRNAALQKFWVLDPEIRNFIGDARDYAWDWNTPGGVPVSGAVEPGTDIAAMLRQIFGDTPAAGERENVIETPAGATPVQKPAAPPAISAVEQFAPSGTEKIDSVSAEDRAPEDAVSSGRHGGALPA